MNSQKIHLSIIIVTFNSCKTIRRCIETLAQAITGCAAELILIDNASNDGTIAVLEQSIERRRSMFATITVLRNRQNLGYTRAVNQGLAICRGELVLLLNPDIEFAKPIFASLASKLERKEIVAVAPQLQYLNGRIQPSCRRLPLKRDVLFEALGLSRLFPRSPFFNRWRMPDFPHDSIRPVDQPQGAFLLIKCSVLKAIGHLDERFPMFFSDVDLCRRLQRLGSILFCGDVSVVHLQGASVKQVREKMIVSSHRSFADYFAKYDETRLQKAATLVIRLVLLTALPVRLLLTKFGRG